MHNQFWFLCTSSTSSSIRAAGFHWWGAAMSCASQAAHHCTETPQGLTWDFSWKKLSAMAVETSLLLRERSSSTWAGKYHPPIFFHHSCPPSHQALNLWALYPIMCGWGIRMSCSSKPFGTPLHKAQEWFHGGSSPASPDSRGAITALCIGHQEPQENTTCLKHFEQLEK